MKQHHFTGRLAMGLDPVAESARKPVTTPLRRRSEPYRAKSGIFYKGL
jgi:hypothetical protein